MGLLGAGLGTIEIRIARQIGGAILLADIFPHRLDRLFAEVGGVGTHVGDVTRFIETLGHHHGLLDPEAQPGGGRLLQGGGDEGGGRLGAGRLVFPVHHLVVDPFQGGHGGEGLGLGHRLEVDAVAADHFHPQIRLVTGQQIGVEIPELHRHEGLDLALFIDDEAHRDGLHPTGGETAGQLLPQERGDHVAHDAVEETTGLLGVDAMDVQLGRLGKRLLDRGLGDLVEHHALVAAVVAADDLAQVPGDRFPFSIQVGCEIDGVGLGGQTLQLADHFFLAGQNLVVGLPACGRVDPHPGEQGVAILGRLLGFAELDAANDRFFGLGAAAAAGRQIAHVTDAGFHHVVLAQIFVDGLGLGRRLHYDQ